MMRKSVEVERNKSRKEREREREKKDTKNEDGRSARDGRKERRKTEATWREASDNEGKEGLKN